MENIMNETIKNNLVFISDQLYKNIWTQNLSRLPCLSFIKWNFRHFIVILLHNIVILLHNIVIQIHNIVILLDNIVFMLHNIDILLHNIVILLHNKMVEISN